MQDDDILEVVKRLRKLEAKGRRVKNEVDGIRSLLRDEFTRRGTDEIKVGRYRVRRRVYDRLAFDSVGFQQDNPELYFEYRKPQTVTRIEVMG